MDKREKLLEAIKLLRKQFDNGEITESEFRSQREFLRGLIISLDWGKFISH